MHPEIEKLQNTLAAVTIGRSPREMSWHPPGKWCATEIVEHLYLSYTGTVKGFEKVLAAGKPLGTSPTLKQLLGTFLVVRLGIFPKGRKAPRVAEPKGLAPDKFIPDLYPRIAAMDEIITQCERQFGAGRKLLDHPILGPLDAHEWRRLHLEHCVHHVKQIRHLWEIMPPPDEPCA